MAEGGDELSIDNFSHLIDAPNDVQSQRHRLHDQRESLSIREFIPVEAEDRRSSLEIETGVGRLSANCPEAVHQKSETSTTVLYSRNPHGETLGQSEVALVNQGESLSTREFNAVEEEDRGSSLEIETGIGRLSASYPPSVHQEFEISSAALPSRNPYSETLGQYEVRRVIRGCTEMTFVPPDENNSDRHQHSQEQDVNSSLAVETGTGRIRATYLPTIHQETFVENTVSSSNPVSEGNSLQTARLCTSPSYQKPHFPTTESYGSDNQENTQALALPKSTCDSARRSQRPHRPRSCSSNGDMHSTHPVQVQPGPIAKRKHPEYKSLEQRLLTFVCWPHRFPEPYVLAEAGMFYLGPEEIDTVCCYNCGNTMHSFQPTDNPDKEHKKYFPHCAKTTWVD